MTWEAVNRVLRADIGTEEGEAESIAFALSGSPTTEFSRWFADGITRVLQQGGHRVHSGGGEPVRLVLHFTDRKRPRPYRRRAQATFVATVVELSPQAWTEGAAAKTPAVQALYPLLVRSLSNLLIAVLRRPSGLETHLVTPEQGYFVITGDASGAGDYFEQVALRLMPIATSHLVIDNLFEPDLARELWEGNQKTRELGDAGRRLGALDLLPAPFPLDQLLSPHDLRHLQRLYNLGGLSYGNLSVRHTASYFWMSASGVDKSNLRTVGEDMQLVVGYEPHRQAMRLSVPPHVRPRRVSVDAIEHWMIYTEHPGVGAIIHVHAWVDGIPSTAMSYPCGTVELARAVAELVRTAPDPSRAIIGLKNHGITVTGRNMGDIFQRLEGRIRRTIPMT